MYRKLRLYLSCVLPALVLSLPVVAKSEASCAPHGCTPKNKIPGLVGNTGDDQTLRYLYDLKELNLAPFAQGHRRIYFSSDGAAPGHLPIGTDGDHCGTLDSPCLSLSKFYELCVNSYTWCIFDNDLTDYEVSAADPNVTMSVHSLEPRCASGEPCIIISSYDPYSYNRPRLSLNGATFTTGGGNDSMITCGQSGSGVGWVVISGVDIFNPTTAAGGPLAMDMLDQLDCPMFIHNSHCQQDEAGNETAHCIETESGDDCNDTGNCGVITLNYTSTTVDGDAINGRIGGWAVMIGEGLLTRSGNDPNKMGTVVTFQDMNGVIIGHEITNTTDDIAFDGTLPGIEYGLDSGDQHDSTVYIARTYIHDINVENAAAKFGAAVKYGCLSANVWDHDLYIYQMTSRRNNVGLMLDVNANCSDAMVYMDGSMVVDPNTSNSLWNGSCSAICMNTLDAIDLITLHVDTNIFEWDIAVEEVSSLNGSPAEEAGDHAEFVADFDDPNHWGPECTDAACSNNTSSVSGMIDGSTWNQFSGAKCSDDSTIGCNVDADCTGTCEAGAATCRGPEGLEAPGATAGQCWGAYTTEYLIPLSQAKCLPAWVTPAEVEICGFRLNGAGGNIGAR